MDVTWDGLPIAREDPRVVCVVVWRDGPRGREFLLLHRLAPGGPAYEGDWAWTPPAGARQPGEPVALGARRELREETELELELTPLAAESPDVALFIAQAPPDVPVVLDDEHDRFEWLPLELAAARCLPAAVARSLVAAEEFVAARARRRSPRLDVQPRSALPRCRNDTKPAYTRAEIAGSVPSGNRSPRWGNRPGPRPLRLPACACHAERGPTVFP